MKVNLSRNIYFHSPETGLVSKTVCKDYNWDVIPVVGHTVDDSAWHRKDITVIEEVNITSSEGDVYYVTLNPLKVGVASDVERYVEIVSHHGWKPFSF
nr:hypothetical protein [uncultured Vibrio sp.]